ncbi:MAG: dihydrofolate reductase [Aquisalinus sp.]|nr:dihydrofolate reductase [Aquisalinus sp.]
MIDRQTNLPIALVVAAARNNTIGREGNLPWRLSDDLQWFKKVTTGKPVMMGRKTFESIGKPLPNRDNIVITRNHSFAHDDVTVATSLEDAIAIAEAFALARGSEEICIIGGGTIYADALALAAKIYLTRVDADVDGDTYFPVLAEDEWQTEEVSRITRNDKNNHNARMLILTRSRD